MLAERERKIGCAALSSTSFRALFRKAKVSLVQSVEAGNATAILSVSKIKQLRLVEGKHSYSCGVSCKSKVGKGSFKQQPCH